MQRPGVCKRILFPPPFLFSAVIHPFFSSTAIPGLCLSPCPPHAVELMPQPAFPDQAVLGVVMHDNAKWLRLLT